MKLVKRRNNRGIAYIVAIGVLGLLAFMGMFLLQSSSIEYSQTSISVYRTMGRQLAEAAAEEACVMLEERFKDKSSTGFFQQLLWQASTSGPMRTGGQTGKNPSLLNDFTDLNKKVAQTLALRDYHVSRAGFVIDKILPTIKDLRPIPQGVLDYPNSYYRPTDREKPFDNEYSRDFYCTLQIDVSLSLNKQHKTPINYQISKDIKILNLGPIARNYSFFSILGQQITSGDIPSTGVQENASLADQQHKIRSGLNHPDKPRGRLFLWNMPFQSRVYLHGPAIINLENPSLGSPEHLWGGYNTLGEKNSKPADNQAFQYGDTFYGLSYFPNLSRCLFPSKNFSGILSAWFQKTPTKDDVESQNSASNKNYGGIFAKNTVYGGLLPERDPSFWSRIGDGITEGLTDNYFTGSNRNQKFLPAGPYCRTPWRYVAPNPDGSQPSWANIKTAPALAFPATDPDLRLEHRWSPNDSSLADESKIFARVYVNKYNHLSGKINGGDNACQEGLSEFSLNYHNNPDPEGVLEKLGASFSSAFGGIWNVVTLPAQAVSNLLSPLINRFFSSGDEALSAGMETNLDNFYPTNFKFNCLGVATRRLKDETQIPRDSEGRWILNGVYWLDSLTIEAPITYVGTGTLLVCRKNPIKPLVIKGSVLAYRDTPGGPPKAHMNIIYNPFSREATSLSSVASRMLIIEGSGITVEASIYSCYGIKCKNPSGNLGTGQFASFGMDNNKTFDQWGPALNNVMRVSNVIFGNYINFYVNLDGLNDDLWVIHNYQNTFYFEPYNGGYIATQDLLDADENKRKSFEYASHDFFMSPKIQHIGIRGAL